MAQYGGAYDSGCIYSIDTNGTGYRDLYDFNSINGRIPAGSLAFLGERFYGMTQYGGADFDGCLFSIDTNGSGYKKLLDFNISNGKEPNDGLVIFGSRLYGVTILGGAYDSGCMFLIDTDGSGYKVLHNFNDIGGFTPFASPIISNNTLYGMTGYGGPIGDGVIYSYKDTSHTISTGLNHIDIKEALGVYPNPSNAQFTFKLNTAISGTIEIYDITGQMIYKQTIQSEKTEINLRSQPAGMYFYRVITNTGSLIGEGKMVIQQ